jgi:tRNA nucleotidyltransferase (CCA-adding enzyme)
MQTSVIFVEPSLPIGDAFALLESKPNGEPRLAGDPMHVGYEEKDEGQLVHYDDLSRMVAMGLEMLPVECIAYPENAPFRRGRFSPEGVPACDYSRRLSTYFPVYFVAALYELQSLMLKIGMKGYLIGGMPRDLLQFDEKRLNVRDVDITLEGDALLMARFLKENSRNFEIVEAFPEFGTAKVRYKDALLLDLASTRREVYPHCGSLPVVMEQGVSLADDVVRRDFTMNALVLSIHPLGHVLDHADGIRDLRLRHVRVLHPVSFFEDPSRILRAFKFCARFDFELAPETRQLMEHFLKWGEHCFYKGGGERIKQELRAFLNEGESPSKTHWLAFFLESGCYRLLNMEANVFPADFTLSSVCERLPGLSRALTLMESILSDYADSSFAFEAYLCFIFRDWPEEAFHKTYLRLGLTKHERDVIAYFRDVKDSIAPRFDQVRESSSPADIYDLFHGLPLMTVVACLAELSLRSETQMRTVLEAFVRYKRKWENLRLELDGNDLISLGVPEGKDVGRLLDELLHAKLAGQLSDRMAEINAVKRILAATGIGVNNRFDSMPNDDRPDSEPRPDEQVWEQGAWPDVAPPLS